MKTSLRFVALISAFQCFSFSVFGQGSLTPPGAPAPTFKTLNQVEPRKDVQTLTGDANNQFIISQPGSYYLTANITGTSKHGISIQTDNVTLDLCGFALIGTGSSSFNGIVIGISQTNVRIRNGVIRSWGHAIHAPVSLNCEYDDLRVSNNTVTGLLVGQASLISDCMVKDSTVYGYNTSRGSIVRNCTATGNQTGFAISDGVIEGCAAVSNSAHGFVGEAVFRDCLADENQGNGFQLRGGSQVHGCTASSNGNGFVADTSNNAVTLIGCSATSNTNDGIQVSSGCTVQSCNATGNSGDGIDTETNCSVTGCTAFGNHLNGILVDTGSSVVGNTCRSNGTSAPVASGIYVPGFRCRVEGNTVIENGFGIALEASVTGNLVIRNHAAGNTTNNYSVPPGNNFIGTIVNNSAAMNAATNSNVNTSFP